jgi:hypothetical protein
MPDNESRLWRALRQAATSFFEQLDSESVRLFVWPYYIALLAWAIYATLAAQPITSVEIAEVWMTIPGTLFVMIGLVLHHGGKPIHEMSGPQLFKDYLGLWMQVGGHVCMFFVLLAFDITAIGIWSQATFVGHATVFILGPYVLGCVYLALQTIRKLWRPEMRRDAVLNGRSE